MALRPSGMTDEEYAKQSVQKPVARPTAAPATKPASPSLPSQPAPARGLLVDGTPGITPIPGSGLDSAVKGITAFRDNYQSNQAAADAHLRASRLNFINPADPASMKATPSNRGAMPKKPVVPAVAAAPQPAASQTPAVPTPAPQTPASPVSLPSAVGAATQAGGGSAYTTGDGRQGTLPAGVAVAKQPNGVNAFTATGDSVATGLAPGVTTQSFGPPAVQQPVATGPGPAVASTFGQSVISMPDDNQPAVRRPQGAFGSPAAMSEHYNSREDREAQKKMLSTIDSEIFGLSLAAQRGDREAIDTIGRLRATQAQIIGAASGITAQAVGQRSHNENTLERTGMELDASAQRQGTQIQADAALEGVRQQGQDRRTVQRPGETMTAADGTVGRIGSDGVFRPVQTAAGGTLQGKGNAADQELTAAMAATTQKLLEQVNPATDGGYSPEQIAQAQASARQIHQAPNRGGEPPAAAIADLRADPKLAADFDATFGKGASARYLTN